MLERFTGVSLEWNVANAVDFVFINDYTTWLNYFDDGYHFLFKRVYSGEIIFCNICKNYDNFINAQSSLPMETIQYYTNTTATDFFEINNTALTAMSAYPQYKGLLFGFYPNSAGAKYYPGIVRIIKD